MNAAAMPDAGPQRASRLLARIAYTLESGDGAAERVRRVLDVLRQLVPSDRCALLHAPPGLGPELFVVPESAGDRDDLADRLAQLLSLLGESAGAQRETTPPAPLSRHGCQHLALPLIGLEQVVGVLLVERCSDDAYDDESLSLLTVVAAQLASYLTAIRLLEQQAAASRVVAAANEFQQLLLGIVSHDLRNPLAAIIGSATLLLRRGDDPRQTKSLERIVSNGQRAVRIINDLLDVTRSRLGEGIPIDRRRSDLSALLRELVEEARDAFPERDVQLDAPDQVAGEWDADRLAQAVMNLLANALRYSPPGAPVRVSLRARPEDAVIEVHNPGPAIPAETLATIFDPFKRGTGAPRQGRDQGLGLGLYIVQQVVAGHGGRVDARSSDAAGTTFTIVLPR